MRNACTNTCYIWSTRSETSGKYKRSKQKNTSVTKMNRILYCDIQMRMRTRKFRSYSILFAVAYIHYDRKNIYFPSLCGCRIIFSKKNYCKIVILHFYMKFVLIFIDSAHFFYIRFSFLFVSLYRIRKLFDCSAGICRCWWDEFF